MTIEDLDDPSEGRSTDRPAQVVRARLLAATAGALLGLTVFVAVQSAAPSALVRGAAGATNAVTAVAAAPVRATPAVSEPCERTTKRDPAGVITIDGTIGIVGDTFSPSSDGTLLIVRRGAKPGDSISLRFARLSATYAGMAVMYGVGAADQKSPTPWGDQVAFAAGWKPIGMAGSCWRLFVDGADTGLVLAVGP
jgi:hypothetical protein